MRSPLGTYAGLLLEEALVQLCKGYGLLFAFRRHEFQTAARHHELKLIDRQKAYADAARYELAKAEHFLQRFPVMPDLRGLRVLDLGCRNGGSTVHYALKGARHVLGLDLDEEFFIAGRDLALEHNVGQQVEFRLSRTEELPVESGSIDLVLAEDVVEHLAAPELIFRDLRRVLAPGGRIFTRFGPLWFHPHGVHLWEVFPGPWTHLLFPEHIVCEVRRRYKQVEKRGLTYADLGMNQMSVRRFQGILERSGFEVEHLRVAGIGGVDTLPRLPLVGELFSSELEAILRRPLMN